MGPENPRGLLEPDLPREFAVDDKFILLHTVRVKQKNRSPINVLIDDGSTHTIIHSRIEDELGSHANYAGNSGLGLKGINN